jgi:hypothetical protein
MSRCTAQFEPTTPGRRRTTHTCDLPRGHDGHHHCPTCGNRWDQARIDGGTAYDEQAG